MLRKAKEIDTELPFRPLNAISGAVAARFIATVGRYACERAGANGFLAVDHPVAVAV